MPHYTKLSKFIFAGYLFLIVAVAFVGGWYFGRGQQAMGGEMASLADISDCTGSSCVSSLLLLPSSIINATKGQPSNTDFSSFWRTWQIINDRYVDSHATTTKKITDQERIWGAISGMVDSLGDPYTVFMPPVEKTRFEENISGNFSGVGMEVGYKDNVPTVITPLANSPAKKAGILAGDKVLKIDGVSTAGLTLDEAIGKIRGKEGTTVVLTIQHEKDKMPVDIKITRAIINIPTLDTKIVTGRNADDKIFVISLYNFSSQSANLFRNAIKEFATTGSHKLILDLRGNPGGYLEAAVDMASWFLPEGKVVVRESYAKSGTERVYKSAGYDLFKDKKLQMIILVDKGSASASEILAGALSEYKIAKLVGEKTFGKGSVQELVPITKDSSLKVTIARWLTPNGKSISENGLEPNVTVKMPAVTATTTLPIKDLQFDKAVEILKAAN